MSGQDGDTVLVQRVLGDFSGDWLLTKSITHGDGTVAAFRGTARWRPTPEGAEYEETGWLKVGSGTALSARQTYRWTRALEIFFSDGRFFHRVPPGGGLARHLCDPDYYEATYDFTDWPGFSVVWRVTGPAKDYRMQCLYRRAAPDGA
ncbi:DUF6314 family protein [uncultured Roseobacter sp.]|uniref:DUF6314 family protein n=1 Tax=uncultured Roseobacter sp. TaxID=114847 RepID=UPI00260DF73A|nr:DUF6314 family protein [uncultured Roseobacter sp.]